MILFLVILVTFVVSYMILFAIWQGTFKSDWYTLYNINVAVARKFNDLRLLVNVVFNHPPGAKWRGNQEKAQPLKLIFTDQSKVSTSAGKLDLSIIISFHLNPSARSGELCGPDHRVSVRLTGDDLRDLRHQTLPRLQTPPSQVLLGVSAEEALLCSVRLSLHLQVTSS